MGQTIREAYAKCLREDNDQFCLVEAGKACKSIKLWSQTLEDKFTRRGEGRDILSRATAYSHADMKAYSNFGTPDGVVITSRVYASIVRRKAKEMGMKGKPWLFCDVFSFVMCMDKSVFRNILFSV